VLVALLESARGTQPLVVRAARLAVAITAGPVLPGRPGSRGR
jgi:hypothetical protein